MCIKANNNSYLSPLQWAAQTKWRRSLYFEHQRSHFVAWMSKKMKLWPPPMEAQFSCSYRLLSCWLCGHPSIRAVVHEGCWGCRDDAWGCGGGMRGRVVLLLQMSWRALFNLEKCIKQSRYTRAVRTGCLSPARRLKCEVFCGSVRSWMRERRSER